MTPLAALDNFLDSTEADHGIRTDLARRLVCIVDKKFT